MEGPLLVSGTAEPGNPVNVCVNGFCYDTVADVAGQWSLTIEQTLGEGTHTVTARQMDNCGQVSDEARVTFIVPAAPEPDIVIHLRQLVTNWNPNYPYLTDARFDVVQGPQTHSLTASTGYLPTYLSPFTEWVLPRNGQPVTEAILDVPRYFKLVGYQITATEEDNASAPLTPTAVIDTDVTNPVWISATITID